MVLALVVVAVIFLAIGFLVGALWQSRQACFPAGTQSEWRLSILMNIVAGGNYPLSLSLTHKGRATTLPTGGAVAWSVSDPNLGTVTPDPTDPTKASLVGGTLGTVGTVGVKITFNDASNAPVEVDATSESLTVIDGQPDGAEIAVGAEV